MDRLFNRKWGAGRSAFKGIAWFGGALAWIAAAAIGAVLAVFFAATRLSSKSALLSRHRLP